MGTKASPAAKMLIFANFQKALSCSAIRQATRAYTRYQVPFYLWRVGPILKRQKFQNAVRQILPIYQITEKKVLKT